jgi:hypothetical protein
MGTSDPSWHRRALYGLTNWALWFAGMANLGVGTWSALNESAALAATSLVAGLVLLFAATIDRFESLKGLGIEAKTRQLDQKITQAEDALRRLRELTEVTGAALIDLNSKMGRWNSTPGPRESIALAKRVRDIMNSLGSDPHTVAAAMKPWARIMCRDMAASLMEPLFALVRERVRDLEARRQALPTPLDPTNPEFVRLNAEIARGHEYIAQNRMIGKYALDDYPDRLLALFNEVPVIDLALVGPLLHRAQSFAGDMDALRTRQELPRPEAWIEALEAARAQ